MIQISNTELEIMKVIWAAGEPVSAAQIREMLPLDTKWTGQMVNTLVNRLVKKGALSQNKREVYYYSPQINEQQYTSAAAGQFLDKMFNGNIHGLLAALVNNKNITPKELDELKEFWEKED